MIEVGRREVWLCRAGLCQALAGEREQAVPHPSLLLSAPAVTPRRQTGSSARTSAPAACHREALSASLSLRLGALPAHHCLSHFSFCFEARGGSCLPVPVTTAAADRSSSPAAGAAGLTLPGAGSVTRHFFHPFIPTWMPGEEFGGFPALLNSSSGPCRCSKLVGAQT